MGFIKKQDDNMTIWQFDNVLQSVVNKAVTMEIVKLPNCHDKNFKLAGIAARSEQQVV